jgi:hypothetical protein
VGQARDQVPSHPQARAYRAADVANQLALRMMRGLILTGVQVARLYVEEMTDEDPQSPYERFLFGMSHVIWVPAIIILGIWWLH